MTDTQIDTHTQVHTRILELYILMLMCVQVLSIFLSGEIMSKHLTCILVQSIPNFKWLKSKTLAPYSVFEGVYLGCDPDTTTLPPLSFVSVPTSKWKDQEAREGGVFPPAHQVAPLQLEVRLVTPLHGN